MPWQEAMEGEPARLQLGKRDATFSIELRYRRLMLLPPSMSTREKRQGCVSERTTGSKTSAYSPGLGINDGWSSLPQVMAASDQCMNWGSAGMTAFTSPLYQRSFLLSFPGVVKT
jgi:hypothetical protein